MCRTCLLPIKNWSLKATAADTNLAGNTHTHKSYRKHAHTHTQRHSKMMNCFFREENPSGIGFAYQRQIEFFRLSSSENDKNTPKKEKWFISWRLFSLSIKLNVSERISRLPAVTGTQRLWSGSFCWSVETTAECERPNWIISAEIIRFWSTWTEEKNLWVVRKKKGLRS